jgi:hypothetical protein
MVRLREIPRTATFAWSPGSTLPLIATGTRAGAVDADFSNETVLELWDLGLEKTGGSQELQPSARIATDSGCEFLRSSRYATQLADIQCSLGFTILPGDACTTTTREE